MDKAVGMKIGGIKCDAQDCNYQDETVKVEDYADWVDKPCPNCGGNLLTKADYDNVLAMMSMVSLLNGILPPPKKDEQLFKMKLDMNGTGKIDASIEK